MVDTEVGYAELSGVKVTGEVYEIEGRSHVVRVKATREFTMKNYSVKINPRNVERIATDMGIPLSGTSEALIPVATYEESFELPDMVCGNYKVTGEAYYDVNGTVSRFEDQLILKVPCKSFKSRIISGLVSILPYGLLKIIAGWAGFQIG
jgi:hypothetical protein